MKISLDWLRDYVSIRESPEDLAERLTDAGLEVKGVASVPGSKDRVLEIEITSNRPDWLSHVGVAREISAVTGARLSMPPFRNDIARGVAPKVAIDIENRDLCPYYSATLLEGVQFGASPDFMRARLEAVGMRPINLVVDVTNYVLLEMGQPLHAFDWDRLSPGKILVRRARNGEKIQAISGDEYVLSREHLLIADTRHAVAVAGVMGGLESEVGSRTKNILLESAYFAPVSVRRTSKKLGLVSESSYRFERGVDPLGVDRGRERAIFLIRKYAKHVGRVSVVFKGGKPPVRNQTIALDLSEISRILGMEVPRGRVRRHLVKLGLAIRSKGTRVFSVKVPSFRSDLTRPIDLVEEVARLEGYDRIPETLPSVEPRYHEENLSLSVENRVRDVVLGAGLDEVVTFSLVSEKFFARLNAVPQATRIINPQNKELTLMRPTLLPSLLEVVQTNFYHASASEVRIFEIANLYGAESSRDLPKEELTLGMAMSGLMEGHWLNKGRKLSFFDLKGVLEEVLSSLWVEGAALSETTHPFLSHAYACSVRGRTLGTLGQVSQKVKEYYDLAWDVFLGEISLEKLSALASFDRSFRDLPKYPAARRDMAFVVREDVQAQEVMDLVASLNLKPARRVLLIDLYRGAGIASGKKSLAFSVEYRADDHTLTAEEVSHLHDAVTRRVVERFGAELRA